MIRMTAEEIAAARALCAQVHPTDALLSCADCCESARRRRDLAGLSARLIAEVDALTKERDDALRQLLEMDRLVKELRDTPGVGPFIAQEIANRLANPRT